MLYIFWPDEDAESDDKGITNQIRRCNQMEEKIFSSEEIRLASVDFHCLKCSVKEISDELKKEYKISLVPKVIFFDVRGKKAWQLTSYSSKPKSIAKKMNQIAKRSAKLLEKMSK
jgi:thioredoxin-related protein